MGRRNHLAQRTQNGRLKRQPEPQLPSPAEVTRLRDAALAGMRDAVWGTTLGWLYLSGKISGVEFGAGKRWTELAREAVAAYRAPRQPRSAALERGSIGQDLDPDTEAGRQQVVAHLATISDHMAAMAALTRAGTTQLRAVIDVCELDRLPSGVAELEALRMGLQALVGWWGRRERWGRREK